MYAYDTRFNLFSVEREIPKEIIFTLLMVLLVKMLQILS